MKQVISGVAPANQTKKGQFMNFSQGHSGTKLQCASPEFTKMGEIHELFVLALSLVWFAGATPDLTLFQFRFRLFGPRVREGPGTHFRTLFQLWARRAQMTPVAGKTPEFTKMGEIHELFVLALSLIWFAGATPDKS